MASSKEYVNFIVEQLSEIGEIHMNRKSMALIYILKKTKNLNQYFSKPESDELKLNLKIFYCCAQT